LGKKKKLQKYILECRRCDAQYKEREFEQITKFQKKEPTQLLNNIVNKYDTQK